MMLFRKAESEGEVKEAFIKDIACRRRIYAQNAAFRYGKDGQTAEGDYRKVFFRRVGLDRYETMNLNAGAEDYGRLVER